MSSEHLDLLREIFPGRATVPLGEVSRVLPFSPRTLLNQHSAGRLAVPSFKVGKCIFVSVLALAKWLDEQAGLPQVVGVDDSAKASTRRGPGRPRKSPPDASHGQGA